MGRDVVAGVAAAAVVLPQALAYATLAGLPVQYGLYVSLVPMLAYAAFGTSRVLSVSTTSTISILTATAVAGVAAAGPEQYEIMLCSVRRRPLEMLRRSSLARSFEGGSS